MPAPPTVTKAFNPASITMGGVSRLTITLSNSNAGAIGLTAAFTDNLPAGVLVSASPDASTTCGGVVTAPSGGSTVTLATLSTIPSGSCTIGVNVTAAALGAYLNTIPAGALQTGAGNNAAPATATLTAVCPPITPSPAVVPNGQVGVAYSQTITGSGGTAPYTFSVASSTLPAGLTLTSAGVLAGTPTTAVPQTFTIVATDAVACSGPRTYTMFITTDVPPPAGCPPITLSPATLPSGTVGAAYSQTITGSGGTAPYIFTITSSGGLPAGLALTSAGVVSGTPTNNGTYDFTIRGTDAVGCFAEVPYTMSNATAVPTLPQVFVVLLALGLAAAGYSRLRRASPPLT